MSRQEDKTTPKNGTDCNRTCVSLCAFSSSQELPKAAEGDYVAREFHFRSGEVLPQLRLHYEHLAGPSVTRTAHITDAVMIVHSTSGNGDVYTRPALLANCLVPRPYLGSRP
jgi:homoserine O-acetyltransferase